MRCEGEVSAGGGSWQVGQHETSQILPGFREIARLEHPSDLVGVPMPSQDLGGPLGNSTDK